MSRRFTVDATKKIQAAPVDFGMLDSMQPLMHDVALDLFEQHRESLIAYADAKFEEVANQINSDIREIYSKYLHNRESAIERFLQILNQMDSDVQESSNVLNGLRYFVYANGDIVTEISPNLSEDIELEGPDVGFAIWVEAEFDGPLEVIHCEGSSFIEGGLEIMFCAAVDDSYRKQVTADTLISTCQQIIYEYAEFVDTQLSKILETAVMKFFKEIQN